jgi:hypothetical protein
VGLRLKYDPDPEVTVSDASPTGNVVCVSVGIIPEGLSVVMTIKKHTVVVTIKKHTVVVIIKNT